MGTFKKGIVVFAVMILSVSSAFSIETIQLKNIRSSSASTLKESKDTVYEGFTVKGGPAVSVITMRDTLNDKYIKAVGFGFEAGVKYDKYYAEFNMALFPQDMRRKSLSVTSI